MHGEGSQNLPEPPLDLRQSTKQRIASKQSEKIPEAHSSYAEFKEDQPPEAKQTTDFHDPNEDKLVVKKILRHFVSKL